MVNGTDRQRLQAPMERLVKSDGIWGGKWKLDAIRNLEDLIVSVMKKLYESKPFLSSVWWMWKDMQYER